MLALPAPIVFGEESKIYQKICIISKKIESAGQSFYDIYEKIININENIDILKENIKKKDIIDETRKKKRHAGGKLKKNAVVDDVDLYEALGISPNCSQDDIRKAYKQLALKHHPDKKNPQKVSAKNKKEDEHHHFLIIQESFEILSDPERRWKYDCSLPFDERIPTASDIDSAKNFFAFLHPYFVRESRWSRKLPTLLIGDENSPIEKVEEFYNFWFNFQSRRDFSTHDEYDLEEAESREEKRWMERQNAKIQKTFEKEESNRIRQLVDLVYSKDRRIQDHLEKRQKEKDFEKNKKRMERQAMIEEQQRVEQERIQKEKDEEERKNKEEESNRMKRKEEKQLIKAFRQRLRESIKQVSESIDQLMLQDLCTYLSLEKISVLVPPFEELAKDSDSEKLIEKFNQTIEDMKIDKNNEIEAKKQLQKEAQNVEKEKKNDTSGRCWSQDELHLLAMGLKKYPGGTRCRWLLISNMIGSRTSEEVVNMTKKMAGGESLKSMGSKINDEAYQQFKEKTDKIQKQKSNAPLDIRDTYDSPNSNDFNMMNQDSEWTSQQQKFLELALSQYPASMDVQERWNAISARVPGKDKKQCVARFRELRERVQNKKKEQNGQ
eukprot:GHVL01015048.1.p1 GENE.GHVL01015048.1~~GHVL01015048.1.p1  ORF type:complete len:609 (+),score=186.51 GHVL01015048.1:176-2002(+)